MTPFEVRWTDAEVEQMLRRVRETRLPPAPAGAGWALGCDAEFLERFRDRWIDGYDWRAAMADLNKYPQFVARVEDQDIHFVHVRGEGVRRRPLIMAHGWPGSHYEFWDAVEPLAFPSRSGGNADDAFDLVIPSLPGFGFSGKPTDVLGQRTTARLWNSLMTEQLGYPTYLAQGGDWGSIVATWLGTDHAASARALHLNMLPLRVPAPPQNDEEAAWIAAVGQKQARLGIYSTLQMMKPQSLAWAAMDNPLGQAAWILERFHDWTDLGDRALEDAFSLDHLITNVMIYVMTGSFTTGAWFYHGLVRESMAAPELPRCVSPTAYAAFPGDQLMPVPPRSRAELSYDISRWTEMPRGGHFAAMEEPGLFIDDIRAWARDAWSE